MAVGNGQGHGRSEGPGGPGFGGGRNDGGSGRGTEARSGSGTSDVSARGTPAAPSQVTDKAVAPADAPAAGIHGDGSGPLRLIELFGEPAADNLRANDATQAGPDLTHREENDLIANGWRGTP